MFNKFYWSRYSLEFLNVDQIRKFTKRLREKKKNSEKIPVL